MEQSVFGRAGMTATRLDDVFAIIPHRAHGYSFDKGFASVLYALPEK